MGFSICELTAGAGILGICPAPGRHGQYAADLHAILGWAPDLVLSMTEPAELERIGAEGLAEALGAGGIGHVPLPVRDFGVPLGATLRHWPAAAQQARRLLGAGGRVLVHCHGGCGRSGMAVLRILVEMGEDGPAALARIRRVRPCAVETTAQQEWGFGV